MNLRTYAFLMLVAYAIYNTINILYVYAENSTVIALLVMVSFYFLDRFIRLFRRKSEIHQSEVFGYLFLLLFVLILMLQNTFHDAYVDDDGIEVVQNITTISKVAILWFFIGGACANFKISRSNVISLALALGVVVVLYMATDENLTIPFGTIRVEQGLSGSLNHLILEKHVIVLLVLAYALSRNMKLICVALALVALFFVGGRTSLFVFLLTAILLTLRGNILTNLLVTGLLTICGVVAFQYGVDTGFIDLDAAAVREILFLDGVEEDNSYQGRASLYKESVPLLADQLWIGDFSLVVERQGSVAGYAHNLLSAWQYYGLFVFLAMIACLCYSAKRMFFALKHSDEVGVVFGSFLLIYVIISVILSRYVGWHLLWFVLGFWLLRDPIAIKKRKRKPSRKRRSVPVS